MTQTYSYEETILIAMSERYHFMAALHTNIYTIYSLLRDRLKFFGSFFTAFQKEMFQCATHGRIVY